MVNTRPVKHSENDISLHAPPEIYEDLRRLAASYMKTERDGHTLQPTALLHEALVRLLRSGANGEDSGVPFLVRATRAMRLTLIDYARTRNAQKRVSHR